jgi:hypothetical protein
MAHLLYPLLASAATIGLRYFTGLSWGWAALAGFVGWPLIGTLVTIDDDFPGGRSNPNGKARPHWLEAPFWGQICLGLGIASFVAALDAAGSLEAVLVGVGMIAIVLSIVLVRRGHRISGPPNKPLQPTSGAGASVDSKRP